jgi:crotonobetainyl-CoA:carnitine CoA-transferase CaiB-like acyl-CoA transferase
MGGYDGASYWSRGGIANALTPPSVEYPIAPRAAFGDLPGGMTIAGGIAAALFARERTGEAPVVDVSLLACAAWALSPDIVASQLYGGDPLPKFDRGRVPNPLVNTYKTADGRFIIFIMMQGDRFWPEFCARIGRDDLLTDERFVDGAARFTNARECVAEIDATMQSKTLDEWRAALTGMTGVWAPVQSANEIPSDPQVIANGYVPTVTRDDGVTYPLVANPVQFDGVSPALGPAPEHGQHTEEILLELGLDWDQIIAHKEAGAVL